MMYFYFKKIKMYYRIKGNGPTILMLHGGLGFDHRYLYPWFKNLTKTHRVIFVDLPGNGKSTRRISKDLLSKGAFVEILEKFRVSVLKTSIIVFGHSYGGYLALAYATKHPRHIKALILDNAIIAVGYGDHKATNHYISHLPVTKQTIINKPVKTNSDFKDYFSALIGAYFHTKRGLSEFNKLNRSQLVYRTQQLGYETYIEAAESVQKALPRIRIPALIIYGRYDFIVCRKNSEMLINQMPLAQGLAFNKSSHFPFIEEKAKYWKSFHLFLNKI